MSTGGDTFKDGNIISMQGRPARAQQIDRIEHYWNTVRGNRLVPSRCEIDPRGMEGLLGHAFILERIAGGLARFRIAGSHLSELSGLELRQMPLSALVLPGSRELLSDALTAVFDEPSVVRMDIASPSGIGRGQLHGELILLPLRSDLGDVDRVLGGIVLEGKIGRQPRRIDILSQTRRSLTGFAGAAPVAVQQAGLDTHAPNTNRNPNRGHLRLVVSND